MAYEFRLPDIGEGLTEAEIIEWRVAIGDSVEMDQVVVEVETDKATVEIPVPVAGTVLHLGAAAGDVVEVGAVLVVVGAAGERWPADEEVEPLASSADAPPIVGTLDSEVTTLPAASADPASAAEVPRALPVVRKLARDLGVDLDAVVPSGPDGRITREDVMAAAEDGQGAAVEVDGGAAEQTPVSVENPDEGDSPTVDEPATEVAGVGDPADEPRAVPTTAEPGRRPLSRLRRTIAEHMTRSWAEIPHVTTFDEVDATRLLEVKRALSNRTGVQVSLDALVVKAVVPALRRYPDFNARLVDAELLDNDSYDVGVAVDTDEGLMVVVVRDAAARSLTELSSEITALAEAARARTAAPSQLSGQTFTISNIGALGGGFGTPIVPYGTIGILSVGRATERPVARHGRVGVAPVMPLSLSYDHRVIDGGQGRRFLAVIVENLTEPALFLAD